MKKKAVFTIVSNNYLHYALTLMDSLEGVNPDLDKFICIIDKPYHNIEYLDLKYEIIFVNKIGIPNLDDILFKYNILEASTAIKPWVFEYILQKNYDNIIYFDPDIYVYKSIDYIFELLKENFIILTPHLTDLLDDGYSPGELDIIKAGCYNLGFIGIRRETQLSKFLKWWQSKLVNQCYIAFEEGIFVDQKWIELVPSIFDKVFLLRDDGYNVAYWNLNHRKITKDKAGNYYSNGNKLIFFHFSGLDPLKPRKLSKYQNRYKVKDIKLVKELVLQYISKLKCNGLVNYINIPYTFNYFSNGIKIHEGCRKFYMKGNDYFIKKHINPFNSYDFFSNYLGIDKAESSLIKQTPTSNKKVKFTSVKDSMMGVNLIGYAKHETGLGESVRIAAGVFEEAQINFNFINFTKGNNSRASDCTYDGRFTDPKDARYPINIFHINADQIPIVYNELGKKFFKNKYNIGYWHWELPDFPDAWSQSFNIIDEVWVPSDFVLNAVSKKTKLPVIKIPHAIDLEVKGLANKRDYDIPEDTTLFLTMFDCFSFYQRKNPLGVIRSFKKAFNKNENVFLIVKINNPTQEVISILKKEKDENILLMPSILTKQEINDLMNICDCLVSLHRSEGFGLPVADAMYIGKPVIATAWSGNLEFMKPFNSLLVEFDLVKIGSDYGPYTKGNTWAEPRYEQASELMRKIHLDKDFRKKIGEAARNYIITHFSKETIGSYYKKRIDFLFRNK